jgi:hypothetical protein
MVGLMDFFTGGDPEQMAQIDPRYGVPRSDVRDAAVNALANLSATLLAAGQPIAPAQRAQLLAGLGGAASGVNADLYNASQRRLMTAQTEQRRGEIENERRIGQLMQDPEAFQRETGQPLAAFRGMNARDVSQALRQIAIAQATPRPPVAVGPGYSLVDPRTGVPLYVAPERSQDPARDRRIGDLMSTFGVSRAEAVGLVDGVLRLDTDPVTGQSRLNNMFTGQSRPFTAQTQPGATPTTPPTTPTGATPTTPPAAPTPAAAPPPAASSAAAPQRPNQTLYELAGTPFTTGVGPSVMSGVQGLLGQVGLNVVSPGLTERRQAFGTAQGELIRSLSINPRFPVAEMERIRSEVNIEPGVMTDPQTLLARMRSVDTSLRARLANEERAANDATLPVDARRDAATAANDIRNFLSTLGVPQTAESPPPAAPRRGTLDRRVQTGAQPTPPPPAVGAVVDGYRFRGGNPADARNWERQ